jgi:hypothetical protein
MIVLGVDVYTPSTQMRCHNYFDLTRMIVLGKGIYSSLVGMNTYYDPTFPGQEMFTHTMGLRDLLVNLEELDLFGGHF